MPLCKNKHCNKKYDQGQGKDGYCPEWDARATALEAGGEHPGGRSDEPLDRGLLMSPGLCTRASSALASVLSSKRMTLWPLFGGTT
jgi:hypothetical protein